MATGTEMMMAALQKMIPAQVWEVAEKTIMGLGKKVEDIEARLRGIEEVGAENNALLKQVIVGHDEILAILKQGAAHPHVAAQTNGVDHAPTA